MLLTDIVTSAMLLGAAGAGGDMPFWATANQFGLMPDKSGAIALVQARQDFDPSKDFQWEWGVSLGARGDMVKPIEFLPDEVYAGVRWKPLYLELGMKRPVQKYFGADSRLGTLSTSAGNVANSGNAMNMPGYSLNLAPVSISGPRNWVQISGAWGDYRTWDNRYVKGAWVHNMKAYLHVNIYDFSFISGLDHYAMWAGTSPVFGEHKVTFMDYVRMSLGMSAPAGSSYNPGDQVNVIGDQKGALLFRFEYRGKGWTASFQHDIPYEDKSGMKFQNFPDGVNTLSFSFEDKKRWVSDVVYEFIYTMKQSGPLHERPATPEEKAKQDPNDPWYGYVLLNGEDDYFNNEEYCSGWTHHGRTIGLPLITPWGTKAGKWNRRDITMGVENNRIRAHHLGISGMLFRQVPYRLMLTYSDNFGTYRKHRKPEEYITDWPGYSQFSAGFNAIIPFLDGRLQLLPGIYFDCGQVLPSRFGATLGLVYNMNFKYGKK